MRPTTHYIDEQGRLDGLAEDLSHHPIVVLEGFAGLGKTELALALAERRRAAGEDVAFIDVTGDRDIGRLQETLGLLVRERPFETRDELLAALHGLRWTLVLDNAEDLLPDEARREELLALLQDLRATGPGFRAVITSRHALAPPECATDVGLFTREVAPLGLSEARQLFIQAAGPRLAPTQAVPEVLDPLLTALGGNARATLLMAGQLGDGVDVAELLRRLEADGANRITERNVYGKATFDFDFHLVHLLDSFDSHLLEIPLVSALNLSLAAAARRMPQSAILFDVLGAFPAGLAQSWLRHDTHPWLADAFAALLEHHLIALVGEARRVQMSAPVRSHAWTRLRQRLTRAKTDEASDLLHQSRRALAREAIALSALLGSEHSAQALIALDQERPNLLLAIDTVLETFPSPDVEAEQFMPIVVALGRAAEYGCQPTRFRSELQTILARSSQAGSGTRATIHFWDGVLAWHTEDLVGAAEAYAEALPLFRQAGAKLNEANTLQALGDLKQRTHDLVSATAAYAAALSLFRQIEDRLGEANTLKAMGDLKRRTDDLAGAAEAYTAALLLYRQIEIRLGEAETLTALGHLNQRTDDLSGAAEAYTAALSLHRQIKNQLGEANTLKAIGNLKLSTNDLTGAAEAYAAALLIYREIEDRLGEASTLKGLGDVKKRNGDLAGATEAYAAALQLHRQLKGRLGEANTLRALGDVKQHSSDLKGAAEDYDEALRICREIKHRPGEADALKSLGDLKLRTDDLAGAVEAYSLALSLFRQIEDRRGEADALKSLGDLKRRTDDLAEAAKVYFEAISLYRITGDTLGEAHTLRILGEMKLRTSDLTDAAEYIAKALDLCRKIKDRFGEAHTLKALGDLKLRASDLDGADEAYAAALLLYHHIQHEIGEGNTLLALGTLKQRTLDLAGAYEASSAALRLFRRIDSKQGEGHALRTLGDIKLHNDDLSGATECYTAALSIFHQIDDRSGQAYTLLALGDLNVRDNDTISAAAVCAAALPLFRQSGDHFGEANTLQLQGQLALIEGRTSEAFALTLMALRLHQAIDDRLGQGAGHAYLARIALAADALKHAIALNGRALQIFISVGNRHDHMSVLIDLGLALLNEAPEEGLACLLKAQTLAHEIGDPSAEKIERGIQAMIANHDYGETFTFVIAEMRTQAPALVSALFDRAEAAIARGELDPYTLPPQADAEETRDDDN